MQDAVWLDDGQSVGDRTWDVGVEERVGADAPGGVQGQGVEPANAAIGQWAGSGESQHRDGAFERR